MVPADNNVYAREHTYKTQYNLNSVSILLHGPQVGNQCFKVLLYENIRLTSKSFDKRLTFSKPIK